MRTVWFNCQAGVAGDMAMAALIDAGADGDAVAQCVAGLGLDGYALAFERVQRCGVGATWANVVVHDEHPARHVAPQAEPGAPHQPHRPAREVIELLAAADLPDRVRSRAAAVYAALAAVESRIHDVDPSDVELHEVGAVDSIIDVVGVCAALESLGVDDVRCSPIAVGTGTIRAAHGAMPNPAPATIALLSDAGAPILGLDTELEVTTPTGAALMTAIASGFGPLPAMEAIAVGYGAGTADPADRANVVQAVVGATGAPPAAGAGDGAAVVLVEVHVDDVTGEVLAHTVGRLLDVGAHDAWVTPIVMKKGRPAAIVSALCDPAIAPAVRRLLLRETGSLGVRATTVHRWPQRREMRSVDVNGHTIGVKLSEGRVKVEFDDAAAAAAELAIPVRTVIEMAIGAVHAEDDPTETESARRRSDP